MDINIIEAKRSIKDGPNPVNEEIIWKRKRAAYFRRQRFVGLILMWVSILVLFIVPKAWPIMFLAAPVGSIFIMARRPICNDILKLLHRKEETNCEN